MLLRFIGSIRRKPKAVKEQYALWIAILFTSGVIVLWIANFPVELDDIRVDVDIETDQPETDVQISEGAGPARQSPLDIMGELTSEIQRLNTVQTASSTVSSTESQSPDARQTAVSSTSSSTVSMNTPAIQPEVRIATFTPSTTSTTQ